MLRALVAFVWILAPALAVAQDEAQEWLRRAALAAQQRDFVGVLAFVRDGQFDTVRVERDGDRQRVVALTGDRREVLAEGGDLRGRFPGGVEMQATTGWLNPLAVDNAGVATLARHYKLTISANDRIAGLDTAVLDATPVDKARYAYRLWFDRDSGLLVGSLLLTPDGNAVERQVFTRIRIGPLRPPTPAAEKAPTKSIAPSDAPKFTSLPDGFVLVAAAPADEQGERQYVYVDGMASLSIYLGRGAAALQGASARGALNAYGRDVNGGHVVVVGELPAGTVQRIADAVTPAQLPH